MKFIVRYFLVAVAVIFSCQISASAESGFVKFSKIPNHCKDGKPDPTIKRMFEIETSTIESRERTATLGIELAQEKLRLYLQNRGASYREEPKAHMSEALAQIQKNLEQRFEMADAALSAGCLTLADAGFRAIIRTYTGAADQAARDRAKIGIDDVRAKLHR